MVRIFYAGQLLGLCWLLSAVDARSCWRDTPCSGPTSAAFSGVWDNNIYAPASRTVRPASTLLELKKNAVTNSRQPATATLHGNGSLVVFDFGKEVGGIVHLDYTASAGSGGLGLAFTEAKNWIGEWSDSSNAMYHDGALYANFSSAGKQSYAMPDKYLRGGFRYLTVFLVTNSSSVDVHIDDVSVELAFQPTWSDLRAYQGYFHCSDELLNRIWYAGAYTLQTNEVPVTTGRLNSGVKSGWLNNGTLGPGDTIIVDGAKRDRAVWPGDMGIAVPSAFVSLGDLDSVKNALQIMYNTQDPKTGAFAESGPPLSQKGSDTYHMWTMIGTYNYVLFTNDTAFLRQNWAGYQRAMDFILAKVTYPSGLLNVTGTRDWARWQQGFNNSEAQMILYHALQTGAALAPWAGGGNDGKSTNTTNLASVWTARAAALQTAINTHCWDDEYGAFRDNATTSTHLHPQDANSMAILFGVIPPTSNRTSAASTALVRNWTPLGAVPPELPGNISPFISSFEIQAHFVAGQPLRALDLVRRSWGWYANHPNGTGGSTVVEGYRADGSFGYRAERGYGNDPSYVSHAHGWSAGPTSALTTYVAGLSITEPIGKAWRVAPQLAGGLQFAEAGFVTGLGKFRVGWAREEEQEGGVGCYTLQVQAPSGTRGSVVLPWDGQGRPAIVVNGQVMTCKVTWTAGAASLTLPGGEYSIVVC